MTIRDARTILIAVSIALVFSIVYFDGMMQGVTAGLTFAGLLTWTVYILCGPIALGVGAILAGKSHHILAKITIMTGCITVLLSLSYLGWSFNSAQPSFFETSSSAILANCILLFCGVAVGWPSWSLLRKI